MHALWSIAVLIILVLVYIHLTRRRKKRTLQKNIANDSAEFLRLEVLIGNLDILAQTKSWHIHTDCSTLVMGANLPDTKGVSAETHDATQNNRDNLNILIATLRARKFGMPIKKLCDQLDMLYYTLLADFNEQFAQNGALLGTVICSTADPLVEIEVVPSGEFENLNERLETENPLYAPGDPSLTSNLPIAPREGLEGMAPEHSVSNNRIDELSVGLAGEQAQDLLKMRKLIHSDIDSTDVGGRESL